MTTFILDYDAESEASQRTPDRHEKMTSKLVTSNNLVLVPEFRTTTSIFTSLSCLT